MVFLSLGRSDRGTPSDYSRAYWNGFQDHIRNIPWNDMLNKGASAAATEFREYIQVGTTEYIPRRE